MIKKMNILIVDDEINVLDGIRKLLKKENYSVTTVLSVREALIEMEWVHFDIILTDLMMPEINGLDFLYLIKNMKQLSLVIMLTGYASINSALQAAELGVFDYLSKPFTKEELIRVINRASAFLQNLEESPQKKELFEKQNHLFNEPGANCWYNHNDDGSIFIGIERHFLYSTGKIQTVYMPQKGDIVRQGAVFFQIFSSDLKAFALNSPFSGIISEVNELVIADPNKAFEDPYGSGWIVKLTPTEIENELKGKE